MGEIARKPRNPPTLCLAMGSSGGSPENIGRIKSHLTSIHGLSSTGLPSRQIRFRVRKGDRNLGAFIGKFSEFPRLDLKVNQPFGTMKQKVKLYLSYKICSPQKLKGWPLAQ